MLERAPDKAQIRSSKKSAAVRPHGSDLHKHHTERPSTTTLSVVREHPPRAVRAVRADEARNPERRYSGDFSGSAHVPGVEQKLRDPAGEQARELRVPLQR